MFKTLIQIISFMLFFFGMILFFITINDLSIITLTSVTFIIFGLSLLSRTA